MSVYDVSGQEINVIFPVSGESLSTAYDVSGNIVFGGAEPKRDYDTYTFSNLFTFSGNKMQGFAIYDGKIAQARETYALYIIDLATGIKLKEVSMDFGHGNSCQFSNEFYDSGDEFPLFYIRNTGVWVYRIVGTSSTLIRKYNFPIESIGTYVASFGVDSVNGRMYTASYTEGDYITKTGELRICVWDMTNATNIGDDTYTMPLLSYNDLEWFTNYDAVQGSCYHDGLFFIGCGYTSTSRQAIVLVDTNTLEIAHVVRLSGSEVEGCSWVNDEYMVVGQSPTNITYTKVEFATTTG